MSVEGAHARQGQGQRTVTVSVVVVGLACLPPEIVDNVLRRLSPLQIIRLRATCRFLYRATLSSTLWLAQYRALRRRLVLPGLPPLPPSSPASQSHSQSQSQSQVHVADRDRDRERHRRALEATIVRGYRLERRWTTDGSAPRRLWCFQAHIDRVTSVKLLPPFSSSRRQARRRPAGAGAATPTPEHSSFADEPRWLVTGAVDGYVRVWDLASRPRPRVSSASSSSSSPTPSSPLPSSSSPLAAAAAAKGDVSLSALVPYAEIDTQADVSAIDAVVSHDGDHLVIASGSYYSETGCEVYTVPLPSITSRADDDDVDDANRPRELTCRAAVSPRDWCGTQCVSIRGDLVAVGTYSGLIHLMNWRDGRKGLINRGDRNSTAGIKLLCDRIVSVTRLGAIEVFSLPSLSPADGTSEAEPPSSSSRDRSSENVGGSLLQRHVLQGGRLLRAVAFGGDGRFEDAHTAAQGERDDDSSDLESEPTELSLLVLDQAGMTHYLLSLPPIDEVGASEHRSPSPSLSPPPLPSFIVSRISVSAERLQAACMGIRGSRAVIVGQRAGFPPQCTVRAYTAPDETSTPTLATPFRSDQPTKDELADSACFAAGEEPDGEQEDGQGGRRRRARLELLDVITELPDLSQATLFASTGFASVVDTTTTTTTTTAPSATPSPSPLSTTPARRPSEAPPSTAAAAPSSTFHERDRSRAQGTASPVSLAPAPARTDVLAECAFDDTFGLVALATARGRVWIAEFG